MPVALHHHRAVRAVLHAGDGRIERGDDAVVRAVEAMDRGRERIDPVQTVRAVRRTHRTGRDRKRAVKRPAVDDRDDLVAVADHLRRGELRADAARGIREFGAEQIEARHR